METVAIFIFLDSKITVDSDSSHEIKRHLFLGRKTVTNLDSILQKQRCWSQRSISSKLWFFSVVMDGCESWTIKKAECWRTDAFELWCWRRLLSVPWTEKRSNQSNLKKINPEYSLEGLMLKFQYFGHLMARANSLDSQPHWGWERLKVGEVDDRGQDGWMTYSTQWKWVWTNWEMLKNREA